MQGVFYAVFRQESPVALQNNNYVQKTGLSNGTLHVETIQIDSALLRRTADGAVLTPEILADYAAKLRAQGRREDSVRSCERVLRQFYDFLSADKLVSKNTLSDWRDQLLVENYAVRSCFPLSLP